MMKVRSSINHHNVKILDEMMLNSLVKAMDAMRTDLIKSQTMPFDTGKSQMSTYMDDTKLKSGKIRLCHTMPYDRRNYFHPEFNFKTDKNANAQGLWLETYIHGAKKMYLSIAYAKFLKEFLKGYH